MGKVNFKKLQREDFVAGISAAVVFALVCGLLGGWTFGLLSGLVTGYAVAVARHGYVSALRALASTVGGVVWDVELNGVKVGTIDDSDYAAIRLTVFGDWRNYIAQLMNLGRVAFRLFDSVFVAVPVMVFWSSILVGIFSPDIFTSVLDQLRVATSAEVAAWAGTAARVLLLAGIVGAAVNAALLGARYGFENRFAEQTATMLRLRVGAAADGRIVLSRCVEGVQHLNNERASFTD